MNKNISIFGLGVLAVLIISGLVWAMLGGDGVTEESAETLAAVDENTPLPTPTQSEPVTAAAPVEIGTPSHTVKVAVIGKNRGFLTPNSFDIWEFEGFAGETFTFEMTADEPLDEEELPLDALLSVEGPDGSLIAEANDRTAEGEGFTTDAITELVTLPADGTYRIEARSLMDDGSGSYSLSINPPQLEVDLETLESYTGTYLEGSWEFDVIYYIESGRLMEHVVQDVGSWEVVPMSETEFVTHDGSRIAFVQDEEGNTTGYRIWVSPVHPIGGQWYEAEKVSDETDLP